MSEKKPEPGGESEAAREKRERRARKLGLATEAMERGETFPFPGITREADAGLRASAEDIPDRTTPVDRHLERFENEGMKVVIITKDKISKVWILPTDTDDVEMWGLF